MKITGSLSLNFSKEEELGGSLSLQHLKNPNQQFFKNSKSYPTMVCTLNQIFISVANFGNQLANVFGESSGQICFAVQFSLTFWVFAIFTKFLHPQN
jgi:hypothetical protein